MDNEFFKNKINILAETFNVNKNEFQIRADGRIEWVCEHGVGHTVYFTKNSNGIHGCDGCCSKLRKK